MLRIYWTFRLLRDVVLFGIVNRSLGLTLLLLVLLAFGSVIAAVQFSAPFIYALF